MQRLEVSGAVRPIHGSSGVKRLTSDIRNMHKIHDHPVLWKQGITNIQLIMY
jgi:hypothetical protein